MVKDAVSDPMVRTQTAIDQYREAQKKSGLESESEQKKKDKQ